jgi:uncharacterized Ntn-hydrolase superfamily protein
MTFSLVARCAQTGQFGVAVCSSSPAVGARCAFVRAGVGAATSQNVTDPALGLALLDALQAGSDAQQAMAAVTQGRPGIAWRQLLVVDRDGVTASFSGPQTLGLNAVAEAQDVAAAGNLLGDGRVPGAMVAAFQASRGPLAGRLIVAMEAALAAGGEAGPVHSAGLKVADSLSWPVIDLRVDWAETDPIGQLKSLLEIYAPQAQAYVDRARNPGGAPSFGVPGDL